jgi:hypothetical protein
MKKFIFGSLFTIAFLIWPAKAQHRDGIGVQVGRAEVHVGGGMAPRNGPNNHMNHDDRRFEGVHPSAPHVDVRGRNSVWVGHQQTGVNYHLSQPWEHGRFGGGFGPRYKFNLGGGDCSRFWFSGYYFSIADFDRGYCSNWNWFGDQVIIYEDPSHVGFYTIYNVRLGTYLHCIYGGRG